MMPSEFSLYLLCSETDAPFLWGRKGGGSNIEQSHLRCGKQKWQAFLKNRKALWGAQARQDHLDFCFECQANIYLAGKWIVVIAPCDTEGDINNFPNKTGQHFYADLIREK